LGILSNFFPNFHSHLFGLLLPLLPKYYLFSYYLSEKNLFSLSSGGEGGTYTPNFHLTRSFRPHFLNFPNLGSRPQLFNFTDRELLSPLPPFPVCFNPLENFSQLPS